MTDKTILSVDNLSLAYGDNPGGGAPSGTLVFDIELLEVK